jgi:hypothetical protein
MSKEDVKVEEGTPILTTEKIDEVMLYWDWGRGPKQKSIRELSDPIGHLDEEDSIVLEYYR